MRRNFSPPPADKKLIAVAIYPAACIALNPALDPAIEPTDGIAADCFVGDEDVVHEALARLNGHCALGCATVPTAPARRLLDVRIRGTGVMVRLQRLAKRGLPDLLPAERERERECGAARPVVALPGPAGG